MFQTFHFALDIYDFILYTGDSKGAADKRSASNAMDLPAYAGDRHWLRAVAVIFYPYFFLFLKREIIAITSIPM